MHHAVDDGCRELVVGEERPGPPRRARTPARASRRGPSRRGTRRWASRSPRPTWERGTSPAWAGAAASPCRGARSPTRASPCTRPPGPATRRRDAGGIGFCWFPRDNLLAQYARRARYASQLSHSPGLSLDAPLYFPGHSTRVFFRVTNVNQGAIAVDYARGIAQLVFERVEGDVERSYDGAFVDEFGYRGVR